MSACRQGCVRGPARLACVPQRSLRCTQCQDACAAGKPDRASGDDSALRWHASTSCTRVHYTCSETGSPAKDWIGYVRMYATCPSAHSCMCTMPGTPGCKFCMVNCCHMTMPTPLHNSSCSTLNRLICQSFLFMRESRMQAVFLCMAVHTPRLFVVVCPCMTLTRNVQLFFVQLDCCRRAACVSLT